MLAGPKLKIIQELVAGATREELIWLNGYLAGAVAQTGQEQAAGLALASALGETPARPAVGKITIAYGTETGNAKKLAADFAAKAKKSGIISDPAGKADGRER